jgi:uncharacterized membrane protein YfcA
MNIMTISFWSSVVAILTIAAVMTMTGRGGGNFYVVILVLSGIPIHEAATTGQLILVATAITAVLIFHRHKTIDWKLALVIDPPTDIMAFVGGYYAHRLGGVTLKLIFVGLLVMVSFFMLRPVKERPSEQRRRFGWWQRHYHGYAYSVNLWLAIPITAMTGLVAGMIGISGGSFKVPLMVLVCGVPMRIAVGTSSAMVAATALMGFLGHLVSGDFNPHVAIPLTLFAVMGGLVGSKFSIKTTPQNLKQIFAYTTLAAAVFMALNTLLSM